MRSSPPPPTREPCASCRSEPRPRALHGAAPAGSGPAARTHRPCRGRCRPARHPLGDARKRFPPSRRAGQTLTGAGLAAQRFGRTQAGLCRSAQGPSPQITRSCGRTGRPGHAAPRFGPAQTGLSRSAQGGCLRSPGPAAEPGALVSPPHASAARGRASAGRRGARRLRSPGPGCRSGRARTVPRSSRCRARCNRPTRGGRSSACRGCRG